MTDKAARTVTDWLAPWVVIIAVCLATAWRATGSVGGTVLWGGAVALFTSAIPMAIIRWHMRRGRVTDIHVRHHAHRLAPLVGIVASAAAGLTVMHLAAADPLLLALAWTLFLGVLTTTIITVFWKISFHTAVATMAVVITTALYGPVMLCGLTVVAAIGWSRVRLGDHTAAQAVVGSAWGAVVAAVVFATV